MYHLGLIETEKSPLSLDGWLKWNQEMWKLEAKRVVYNLNGKELPRLEGVIYLDKQGRVRMPKRNPYLPFIFHTTPTERRDRLYNQWLEVCTPFVEELKKRGIVGEIKLIPGLIDGRPFYFEGMDVKWRYTFIGNLPLDESVLSSSVRNKIRKAQKKNYTVKKTTDWKIISQILRYTADLRGYRTIANEFYLRRCQELMGDEYLRGYVAYNYEGKPVSGSVRLIIPGGIAIARFHGTLKNELSSGVNQLVYYEAMNDAYLAGSKYFDLGGANIPVVAQAKAAWGFPLVPYLSISSSNLHNVFYKSAGKFKQKLYRPLSNLRKIKKEL